VVMFGEDGEIASSILPSQDENKCQLSRRQAEPTTAQFRYQRNAYGKWWQKINFL